MLLVYEAIYLTAGVSRDRGYRRGRRSRLQGLFNPSGEDADPAIGDGGPAEWGAEGRPATICAAAIRPGDGKAGCPALPSARRRAQPG